MDDIEKRARELLAAEYERYGDAIGAAKARFDRPADGVTLRAIITALTTPDGFVLVPLKPTQEMVDQGTQCTHAEDWEVRSAWIYMLSHRPEVK